MTAARVGPGTVAAPVSLLLLVTLCTRASSFTAVHADKGDEPALTLEDLDDATECLLLTTVTSLAAGLECVFDLHGWSSSDVNVEARTCDGVLAPYTVVPATRLGPPTAEGCLTGCG